MMVSFYLTCASAENAVNADRHAPRCVKGQDDALGQTPVQ